jgi:endoglucanase
LACLAFSHEAGAQLTIPRGRPQLNAARTTFVADNGQLLRGPYTSTEWTAAAPAANIAKMKELGFNALHLYAEVFSLNYPATGSTAPGYNVAEVDKIVAATRTNGLYLIMTIGNGANNGNHNRAWATNFWSFYAPRYANETHVIFEIHNEPLAWGPSYLTQTTPAGTLDMEVAAYQAIRAHAPHTPVLLFSYAVFSGTGGANAALTDIRAFNQSVFGNQSAVWTNEAVAFHGYGGWDGTATAVQSLINAGYPCFMTEFGWHRWGTSGGTALEVELTTDLERLGVSWLTFQYVPPSGVSSDVTRPELFKNVVDNAGLSWTPDYGTWPAARGIYGNNGQPRATVANWVNNFLTGTLRIQAEDFDWGGEGVSYHDTDASNTGGQYRPGEAVDIKTCNDTGGGFAVTASDGEWMEYTILVREPGWHDLRLRYTTPNSGCAVEVLSNARDTTGPWTFAPTGSATTWATATVPVYLGYGRQKVRFQMPAGGFDLNWLELSPAATGVLANGTYKLLNAANARAMEAVTSTNSVFANENSGLNSQQWSVQHMGGGQYKITSAVNGSSWNGAGSSLGLVSSWSTSDDRNFIPLPSSGGFQRFVIVSSGLCLNTSVTNAVPLLKQEYSGAGPAQQWLLVAPSAPAFPTGLKATAASSTQVALTWNSVAGATNYLVKRSGGSGGPYTAVATGVTATNHTNTVVAGVKYYYVVSAIVGGAESANSLEASVNPPPPWASQDLGSVGVTGNAAFNDGVFTLGGSGADIWGTTDAFRFVSVPMTGNGTITARVLALQNTDGWAKAGLMIRQSLAANSANAFIAVTPGNGVIWQYRTSTGGSTANNNTTGLNAPHWVRLVRSGTTFTGYRSPDGVTWTQQGSAVTISSMTGTLYVGLALTSHNISSLCTATFDNVTVPGWQNLTAPPAPTGLIAAAAGGKVDLTWQVASIATSYKIKRAPVSGGPYIVVATATTTNFSDTTLANGVAYSYVMSAVNLAGESANSAKAIVPGQIVAPNILSVTTVSATQIQLVWSAFTAASSYNVKRSLVSGGPYTTVATGITATNFTDTIAPDTKYYYVVSAVVEGNETSNSAEAAWNLPYPWLTQDVGTVGFAGSATYNHGMFAATGSGDDIWNAADAFRFTYVPVTGNCVITARVLALQNTDPWAKAGVMIRQTLTTISANAFMAVTPGNGVTFQHRTTAGGTTANSATTGLNAPHWVRLVRSGNTFTGYRSPDGTNWTQQGSPQTISMAGAVYAGLALTAHNNSSLCAASFDDVTAPGWPVAISPASAPTGLTATPVSSIQINLTWNTATNAISYNVKRSLTDGGPYTVIAPGVATTNYSDSGLNAGETYYYVVSAANSGGESANSAQVGATALPIQLGALVHRYSFSETGGASIADSIGGPAWIGTLPAGGTFASGQLTLASASSQYAALPAGIVSTLNDFTLEAWVRLNSTTNWSRIFDFGQNTTTNMFLTPQNGSTTRLRFAITTNGVEGEQQITGTSALAAGVWYHVAVTLSGNTGLLYLNGIPVGTNNSMTLRPASLGFTANNYVGRSQYSDPCFNGLMDEIRISSMALSRSEIAATHALGPNQGLSAETPALRVNATPGFMTLKWPLAAAGFTLQSRPNLVLGNWVNITSPGPQIVAGQWQVVLPIFANNSVSFYRLAK